ncbi:cell division protein FtsA [Thermovibrio sp.]
MITEKKILTIDLGTSSIRTALTLVKGDKRQTTIATTPSRGIKNGNIINVPSAKDSLRSALNRLKLESTSALPLEAYVIVPGGCTLGYEVEAKISFPGIKTINYNDVNMVKNKVKDEIRRRRGLTLKSVYEIIHILPQEFIVDNVDGIQNPIGHSGRELTMKAFVILASKSYLRTLDQLLREVGLKLKGVVLQTLASYYAVKDDKTYFNNNLFIYLGAGNTEVLYLREDAPVFFKHEPFGAEDVIDFFIQQLKVNRKEAERLFKEYGSAYAFNVNPEEVITINYGTKALKVQKIVIPALIHLQLKKLVKDIKKALDNEDPSFITHLNRVYITGGFAKLKDITTLFEKLFKAPVVVVSPEGELKDPALSPIEGVVNYVLSLNRRERLTDIKEDLTKDYGKEGFFSAIWRFLTQYI